MEGPGNPQSRQPFENVRCMRLWSRFRAKTSRRPTDRHEEAAGPEISSPPSDSQRLHGPLKCDRCQSALSVPLAKTVTEPRVREAAAGREVSPPPSDTQSFQLPFANRLCQRAKSSPRPKTSRRPGPREAAAGPVVNPPPKDSQGLHPISS